jgi:hypothetical protein
MHALKSADRFCLNPAEPGSKASVQQPRSLQCDADHKKHDCRFLHDCDLRAEGRRIMVVSHSGIRQKDEPALASAAGSAGSTTLFSVAGHDVTCAGRSRLYNPINSIGSEYYLD